MLEWKYECCYTLGSGGVDKSETAMLDETVAVHSNWLTTHIPTSSSLHPPHPLRSHSTRLSSVNRYQPARLQGTTSAQFSARCTPLPAAMSTVVSSPLPTPSPSLPDVDVAPPSPSSSLQSNDEPPPLATQDDPEAAPSSTLPSQPTSADEQLDQLAEQSVTSPAAFLSLLALLRPRLFALASLPADGAVPSSAALSAEKRRALHHLSKLKLSYLHLQAKTNFLRLCEADEEWPEVSDEERQRLEREIQQTKAEQTRAKQQLADSRASLQQRIETFAAAWTQIEQQADEMEQQWDETDWTELRAAMDELGVTDVMQMCDEHFYTQQLHDKQALLSQLQADVAAMEADVQQRRVETDKVAARLAAMQADTTSLLTQLTPASHSPQPSTTFYQQATLLLGQLTGITCRRLPNNDRSLLVAVEGWTVPVRRVEMEVDCVPGSVTQFNGVRLVEGEVEWTRWDEMVDYALEMQDLAFLVREVQQYLSTDGYDG